MIDTKCTLSLDNLYVNYPSDNEDDYGLLSGTASTVFTFEAVEDGYYFINVEGFSHNHVHVRKEDQDENDHIYVNNSTSEGSYWEPIGVGNDQYMFRNKRSGLYMKAHKDDGGYIKQEKESELDDLCVWSVKSVDGPPDDPIPSPSALNKLTQFSKGNYDDIYKVPPNPTFNFAALESLPTTIEDYHIMVQCEQVRGGENDLNQGPYYHKPVRGHILDVAIHDGSVDITKDEIKASTASRIITKTIDYTVKNLMTNGSLGGFDYKICTANIVPDDATGWQHLNLDTWDKRLPKIIENIKDYDLVCCQEMNQGQVNTIMDSTLVEHFGVVSSSKSMDAAMIFYNKDKFNLVDYFTPLPDNKDMGIGFINECWEAGFFTQEEYDHLVWEKENLLYHTKNFCLGVFQEKSTGRVLLCIGTHFSSNGNYTEYKNTIKLVYDRYLEKYNAYNPVVVFGADTNQHTDWGNDWLNEFNDFVFKPLGAGLLYDGGDYEQVDKIYGHGTTSNESRGPGGLSDHYFIRTTVHV